MARRRSQPQASLVRPTSYLVCGSSAILAYNLSA